MRASRILGLALAVAAVSLVASTPSHANCGGPLAIFQAFSTTGGWFAGCGTDQAYAFFWERHFAVQRNGGANATTATTAGIDSGAFASVADGFILPYDTTGGGGTPTPGAYQLNWDWGNFGPDGCPLIKLDADISCIPTGGASLPVTAAVIAGSDTGSRLQAKAAVISVDGNEPSQFYILDQAGAVSIDALPCGNDANQFTVAPPTCGLIPKPAIGTFGGCTTGGCTLNLTVGAHTVPFIDDCAVAMSKGLTCPRNDYVGRQIFIRRAPCGATAPGAVGAFDTRTFIMDPNLATGNIVRNFVPYYPQDKNLNGILDGTETGPLTPVILSGNASAPASILIPKIAGATDCAFLGVALVMDSAPDATSCGGAACEAVVTPLVSVNGIPISLDTATPAADRVINLVAGKKSGKANVSWDTTAEFATAGFNLIGTKKSGGTISLNSSLIQAKKGTTGEGASYSVDLGGWDLKGSTAVYVEVVKTNGAKERFGPVSF